MLLMGHGYAVVLTVAIPAVSSLLEQKGQRRLFSNAHAVFAVLLETSLVGYCRWRGSKASTADDCKSFV